MVVFVNTTAFNVVIKVYNNVNSGYVFLSKGYNHVKINPGWEFYTIVLFNDDLNMVKEFNHRWEIMSDIIFVNALDAQSMNKIRRETANDVALNPIVEHNNPPPGLKIISTNTPLKKSPNWQVVTASIVVCIIVLIFISIVVSRRYASKYR